MWLSCPTRGILISGIGYSFSVWIQPESSPEMKNLNLAQRHLKFYGSLIRVRVEMSGTGRLGPCAPKLADCQIGVDRCRAGGWDFAMSFVRARLQSNVGVSAW